VCESASVLLSPCVEIDEEDRWKRKMRETGMAERK
jgi:hypothetical protein